jgi:hypothetical protein
MTLYNVTIQMFPILSLNGGSKIMKLHWFIYTDISTGNHLICFNIVTSFYLRLKTLLLNPISKVEDSSNKQRIEYTSASAKSVASLLLLLPLFSKLFQNVRN